MHRDGRRLARPGLDLDEAGLRRRALAEAGGRHVLGQHIGVAVQAGRIHEIKAPLILAPGPAALGEGLDALVAAIRG